MPTRKSPTGHPGRKKKPLVKEGVHGIQAGQIPLEVSSPEIATLAEKVHQVGGNVIGAIMTHSLATRFSLHLCQ